MKLPRTIGLGAAGLLLVAAPTVLVKKLDESNGFCIACHLHEKIHQAMVSSPETVLAAAHHGARDRRAHPERCFTCHSGEGVTGWTAVTALSAVDAARWVLGDRHEPTSMRLPLEDRACLKCHADDIRPKAVVAASPDEGMGDEGSQEAGAQQNYHQIRDHRNVRTACITCHTVHTTGEKARLFLVPAVVQQQCRNCHKHGLGTEG
jgi:hypothetical protein